MRYICEIGSAEHVVDGQTPQHAARVAAAREYANRAAVDTPRYINVIVAEANEADLPLIAGEEHRVEIGPGDQP